MGDESAALSGFSPAVEAAVTCHDFLLSLRRGRDLEEGRDVGLHEEKVEMGGGGRRSRMIP